MTRPPVHPKVRMFLHERDRALARGDGGVVRSMDAELRRLGVSDEATLANPSGKPPEPVQESGAATAPAPKANGRKIPRCEHANVEERCEICHPELAAH